MLTEIATKDNGSMIKPMVKENITILTELFMKDNGSMINNTEKGKKDGKTELNIQVNIKRDLNTE